MPTAVKLALGAAIVVGVTAYMAFLGASDSWKYYLTADECAANAAKLAGQRLRVSGEVACDSLNINAQRTHARFELVASQGRLGVDCVATLPDHLAEGIEVVVEGRLDASGRLVGDKVLTRCVSKYPSTTETSAQRQGRKAGSLTLRVEPLEGTVSVTDSFFPHVR